MERAQPVEDGFRLSPMDYIRLCKRPDTSVRHRTVFLPPFPPAYYVEILGGQLEKLQTFFVFDPARAEWREVEGLEQLFA